MPCFVSASTAFCIRTKQILPPAQPAAFMGNYAVGKISAGVERRQSGIDRGRVEHNVPRLEHSPPNRRRHHHRTRNAIAAAQNPCHLAEGVVAHRHRFRLLHRIEPEPSNCSRIVAQHKAQQNVSVRERTPSLNASQELFRRLLRRWLRPSLRWLALRRCLAFQASR